MLQYINKILFNCKIFNINIMKNYFDAQFRGNNAIVLYIIFVAVPFVGGGGGGLEAFPWASLALPCWK
jgi:hypothetical protein